MVKSANNNNIFEGRKVAYFSMEMGFEQEFSTYSGGLGILAGDTVKSCADLNVPFIGITLVWKKGYFRQELTPEGRQIEHPDQWQPEKYFRLLDEEVEVEIEQRKVKVKAWLYKVESTRGGTVPVLFLDTDVEANDPRDREITSSLYGGDLRMRIKQELILGIGGLRMLNILGVKVLKYHLNEGHASFLILELLKNHHMNEDRVRRLCVFTTHTPVEAGHDKFPYPMIQEIMSPLLPLEKMKEFAGEDDFNMTLLALNLSGFVNGVAKKHMETTQKMFPGYEIRAITNGVHPFTWTHAAFKELYDNYFPGWAHEPEIIVRAEIIPNEKTWEAREQAKKEFIEYLNQFAKKDFDPEILTIGFARRATAYKRHSLLFSDLNRLTSIHKNYPFQIVFAGKAHPQDEQGKQMIEEVFRYIEQLKNKIKIVYLPNYNIEVAKKLLSGVDIWLNTPQRPLEASGTSGMKAALNGVINFSVLDGWWLEGCIEGVTGWGIGPGPGEQVSPEEIFRKEKHDLYGKLEYNILPLYYKQRDTWVWMIENSISKIAYYFHTHRMMRRYISDAYFV